MLADGTAIDDEPVDDEPLTIAGISEATILRYFETLNANEFDATSNLFADDGVMYPPFESGVRGREAIATYLNKEAKGMKLRPYEGTVEATESGDTEFRVMGKVQTAVFGINVAWFFVLDAQSNIVSTRIKLLASPQDLLKLRR
ncbi:nuclear transport factor 2 family protein [Oculatella sp. LEGE 06141]|nr:nuclear transport factor 2 family protein [Oculatella sp. LEGE 06141]